MSALRRLEDRFGDRYPWLRRPRSSAERAYRLSHWQPIPHVTVAGILAANEMRLIRSAEDVIEGIEAALDALRETLHSQGLVHVGDFWNTPADSAPSPKDEEHISLKVCNVVRDYFDRYAVTADREVQIHRKLVVEGERGSRLDVLVRVPARGVVDDRPLAVPIEVKLSCNDEAKTAIKVQLVDRYMRQLGVDHGVYVLVWMDHVKREMLKESHRPKWPDIESARAELEGRAREISEQSGARVSVFVFDAGLR